jgi:hypothetical protein
MVNEYNNPIFLIWMFHTLFPYGLGILEKSLWKVKSFIESKVKHLMNLEDEDHGFSIHHFFLPMFNTIHHRQIYFMCKLVNCIKIIICKRISTFE